MKKFLIVLLSLLLLIVAASLYLLDRYAGAMETSTDIELEILEGSSTNTISLVLEENGLIADGRVFRFFAGRVEVDNQFKAGKYIFEAGNWSLERVCDMLIAGGNSPSNDIRVTIREGLTVAQTAAVLEEAGLGSVAVYMEYAINGDFSTYPYIPSVDDIPAPGNRLDGFLFPDTYMIAGDSDEKSIINMLLAQFDHVWTSNNFDLAVSDKELSVYDAVIMASIIEKEAQVAEDRPIISGVFYNRLKNEMKLESCATIQFLLEEPKAQLLYSDLEIESPYNTYQNLGLPPGPIAAPGLASLRAALFPEETDYYYFRAREDGSHRFSENLAEHEKYYEGDMQFE